MPQHSTQDPLNRLIRMLAGLPGLGPRSARRLALHLISDKENRMRPLARVLGETADTIAECHICGNLDDVEPCHICRDSKRETDHICVVAHVSDLWAIERTGGHKGRYHVLGGLLSAIDGVTPEDLGLPGLIERLRRDRPREVILALSATVDGQSTAHYISDQLADLDITITRLAHGMPVGGELDYLDEGTIMTAFKARGHL